MVITQASGLYQAIQQEVQAAAFDKSPSFDSKELAEYCPLLLSTIQETFRHFSYTQVIRHVHNDLVLSHPSVDRSVHLKKGWRVAAPMRTMHMHPATWGADSFTFRPDRFLDTAGKAQIRNLGTFGGGPSICSGRHFAIPEVASTVIMLLRAFRIDAEWLQMYRGLNPCEPKLLDLQDSAGQAYQIKWTGRKDDGKVVQSGLMRADGKMYMRFYPLQ